LSCEENITGHLILKTVVVRSRFY